MVLGVQSVLTSGIMKMLVCYAKSWGILHMVRKTTLIMYN